MSVCLLIVGLILPPPPSGQIANSCLAFKGHLLAMKFTDRSKNFQDKALNMCRYERKQNLWLEITGSQSESKLAHAFWKQEIVPWAWSCPAADKLFYPFPQSYPWGSLGETWWAAEEPLRSDKEVTANLSSTFTWTRVGSKCFQGT